ncbi:hypothetical protein G6F22_020965 [Rhizopus arrhizus]|nr:hypothetical protein G6F22_020965 [Rhizopus arrhizus]
MVGSAIAAAGTPAQREALEGLIAGAITAALAQAEPESGYDLAQVRTRGRDGGRTCGPVPGVGPHGRRGR